MTSCLQEHDNFIENTREILETVGFKNNFNAKKDNNGNTILDENGAPILKDTRSAFHNAIRSLRNTAGFVEGSCLDNVDAHFIVVKTQITEQQNGGQNKQCLWIQKDALETF